MAAIDALTAGVFRDPEDPGRLLSVPVRAVLIEDSLDGMEAEAVRALGFEGPLAVVSDPRTRAALGERVERALASLGPVLPVHLPDRPHADMATVERLLEATRRAGALIAVGSGTINDLVKMAAARAKKPWAVFATAPSMNGYASANAAITVDGLKTSLPASAPAGVFMDLRVLAAAPARMIRAGLGDSICRATAQADWLLAHLVRDAPYDALPFALLADEEPGLLAEPEALLASDLPAMGRLARTLILSGFGMALAGGSFPASQGEHLIGHLIEMLPPPGWRPALHGEQIAATTVVMARLQARMLAGEAPVIHASTVRREDVIARFGPGIGAAAWAQFARKAPDAAAAEAVTARLRARWDEIRARIAAISLPPERVADILRRAGAPTRHADIGLPAPFFAAAVEGARLIRDRWTFLDLAADGPGLDAEALIRAP